MWREYWKELRKSRTAVFGFALLAVFLVLAVAGPVLSPADPLKQDLYGRLAAPGGAHFLGTDELGRDILSRVLHGARVSLQIGVISVGIALLCGSFLGLVAGYWGGTLDMLIMRGMDLMLAFPSILLAIVIVSILGPSLTNAMLAVGIVVIPQYARQVRASVLTLREMEYVTAARALGAGDARILLGAILPNAIPPLIVLSTLGMGTAILDAAGLSFIGLGAQPPAPEWGAMLNHGREYILEAPWVLTFPGIAILLTVLGFNLFGDGLRDVLDPRSGD